MLTPRQANFAPPLRPYSVDLLSGLRLVYVPLTQQ